MSKNWFKDIQDFHKKFGVDKAVAKMSPEMLKAFVEFRLGCIEEEYIETIKAFSEDDAEEIVDGLIDMCVFAIGTLESMNIDAYKAWNSVLEANMKKKPGIKPERPNPFGLPDMIKPEGWTPPSHEGNHGKLSVLATVKTPKEEVSLTEEE